MTGPIDGDALLAKIKPQFKEVRVQVCLRPDVIEEWHTADEALRLEQAKSATNNGGRLASTTPEKTPATAAAKRLAKKVGELEQSIEDSSIWFTFRKLPKPEYEALCMEHPPRKDNQFDLIRGYNINAVTDALARRCLVDPVFTDDGWLALQSSIGEAEWSALVQGAQDANDAVATPGKSELASLIRSQRGNASE